MNNNNFSSMIRPCTLIKELLCFLSRFQYSTQAYLKYYKRITVIFDILTIFQIKIYSQMCDRSSYNAMILEGKTSERNAVGFRMKNTIHYLRLLLLSQCFGYCTLQHSLSVFWISNLGSHSFCYYYIPMSIWRSG